MLFSGGVFSGSTIDFLYYTRTSASTDKGNKILSFSGVLEFKEQQHTCPLWQVSSYSVQQFLQLLNYSVVWKLLSSHPCLRDISPPRSTEADYLNTPLDLHSKNGQFCVDISDFLDLKWVEKEVEECKTVFEKSCEEKTQNVCLTVNETLCEVSAKMIYSPEVQ